VIETALLDFVNTLRQESVAQNPIVSIKLEEGVYNRFLLKCNEQAVRYSDKLFNAHIKVEYFTFNNILIIKGSKE